MNRERLDQILLRKKVVTEDQLRQALLRQKTHGGLLGSQLLYFKFLTERQILDALGEQCGLPGAELGTREVPEEVLRKVPLKVVVEHLCFPFRFDAPSRTLNLAVVDPENPEAGLLAKQTAMARDVKLYVAVDSVLRNAIQVHYFGQPRHEPLAQIVELPDLFAREPGPDRGGPAPAAPPAKEKRQEVLMVTQALFLKSFLVPIFERDGYNLEVLAQPETVRDSLKERPPDHVLVAGDMEAAFRKWIEEGLVPSPDAPVTSFTSVSRSLLDNPVPYPKMAASLVQALQKTAAQKWNGDEGEPPFALICQDVRELAQAFGMNRLAVDGLQIATLLLNPARQRPAGPEPAKGLDLGVDFLAGETESLIRARELDFPWDLDLCLRSFFRFVSGNPGTGNPELTLAANILAMAWFRHCVSRRSKAAPGELLETFKSALRDRARRPFSPEAVETYIQLLDRHKHRLQPRSQKDIFVISDPNETSQSLSKHLRQQGYRTVEITDFSEALHLYERKQPDVIIMNYEQNPEQALALCQRVRRDAKTLLYAFTTENKPSLVLRLLGSGFNDIIVPPYNFAIVAIRISNSLAVLAHREGSVSGDQGFSATFQELPFVDLIQALTQSQRDVHVKIVRKNGEGAGIYLRNGQMTHARCGNIFGEEAVFQIIRWRDDGSFRLEPVEEFPAENLSAANDYLLLEGLRRFDESRM